MTTAASSMSLDNRMSSAKLPSVDIDLDWAYSGATLCRRYSTATICPVRPYCFKKMTRSMRGLITSAP